MSADKEIRYTTDVALYVIFARFLPHVHVLRAFMVTKVRKRALQIWYYIRAKEYEKYFAVLKTEIGMS